MKIWPILSCAAGCTVENPDTTSEASMFESFLCQYRIRVPLSSTKKGSQLNIHFIPNQICVSCHQFIWVILLTRLDLAILYNTVCIVFLSSWIVSPHKKITTYENQICASKVENVHLEIGFRKLCSTHPQLRWSWREVGGKSAIIF